MLNAIQGKQDGDVLNTIQGPQNGDVLSITHGKQDGDVLNTTHGKQNGVVLNPIVDAAPLEPVPIGISRFNGKNYHVWIQQMESLLQQLQIAMFSLNRAQMLYHPDHIQARKKLLKPGQRKGDG